MGNRSGWIGAVLEGFTVLGMMLFVLGLVVVCSSCTTRTTGEGQWVAEHCITHHPSPLECKNIEPDLAGSEREAYYQTLREWEKEYGS